MSGLYCWGAEVKTDGNMDPHAGWFNKENKQKPGDTKDRITSNYCT